MNYSERMNRAIMFACRAHDGQYRKETEPLPYVSHPLAVALLAATFTEDEDVHIAALFHDILEETDIDAHAIEIGFGPRVRALVEVVTDDREMFGVPLPWKAVKERYLESISKGPDEALYITASDKIHNIDSKIAAIHAAGPELRYKWGGGAEGYAWFHGEIGKQLRARMPAAVADAFDAAVLREAAAYALLSERAA